MTASASHVLVESELGSLKGKVASVFLRVRDIIDQDCSLCVEAGEDPADRSNIVYRGISVKETNVLYLSLLLKEFESMITELRTV